MESTRSFIDALREVNKRIASDTEENKTLATFLGSNHPNRQRAYRQVHMQVRDLYLQQTGAIFGRRRRTRGFINWASLIAWIIENRVLIFRIIITVLPLIL